MNRQNIRETLKGTKGALSMTNQGKMNKLGNQMSDMSEDYAKMKRAREESKRQLDARFADVYGKIQDTDDFVDREEKDIDHKLEQFKENYTQKLQSTYDKLKEQHDSNVEDWSENQKVTNERLNKIKEMIIQEREDRIRETEEALAPIREHLEALQEGIYDEQKLRVRREKHMYKNIAEEGVNFRAHVDEQQAIRERRISDLTQTVDFDTKMQNKHIGQFEEKSKNFFTDRKAKLSEEMDDRFDHQDQVVGEISQAVNKLQKSMKILGRDI